MYEWTKTYKSSILLLLLFSQLIGAQSTGEWQTNEEYKEYIHNLEPPSVVLRYTEMCPTVVPTPNTTTSTSYLCATEGESYDYSYEETHHMKARPGFNCFLGHYTPRHEEKNYSAILSGEERHVRKETSEDVQRRLDWLNQKIEWDKNSYESLKKQCNILFMIGSVSGGLLGITSGVIGTTFVPLVIPFVVASSISLIGYYHMKNIEKDLQNMERARDILLRDIQSNTPSKNKNYK